MNPLILTAISIGGFLLYLFIGTTVVMVQNELGVYTKDGKCHCLPEHALFCGTCNFSDRRDAYGTNRPGFCTKDCTGTNVGRGAMIALWLPIAVLMVPLFLIYGVFAGAYFIIKGTSLKLGVRVGRTLTKGTNKELPA